MSIAQSRSLWLSKRCFIAEGYGYSTDFFDFLIGGAILVQSPRLCTTYGQKAFGILLPLP